MKLVQLTPGAGEDFYCENCLRDAATLRELRNQGVDALSVPLYLPPLNEETGQNETEEEIFFGGVNVFLQQKTGLFQKTPRWLDKLFDTKWLLKWVGKKSHLTSAKVLGETTLSMLRGEHGRQLKELDRLVEFMADRQPDVIVLSNVLLAGLARRLKDKTGARVLCWFQDEDHFLDDLEEPWRTQAWELARQRAADVDLFLGPSEYYRRLMSDRLDLSEEQCKLLYQGIVFSDYQPAKRLGTPAIGFLSQLAGYKGLDLLVEAVARLRGEPQFAKIRLAATGGMTMADRPYVKFVKEKVRDLGVEDCVDFLEDYDRASKAKFFANLDLLAVPARRSEAFARYLLEAMASGLPVVAPACGAQKEIVERTGGGLLHEPENVDDLVEKIRMILTDDQRAAALAENGRDAVAETFDVKQSAARMIELANQVIDRSAP
jgi:glycosyltransferase involved in cell wall biosynthesis